MGKKKADVAENPEISCHVGLLVNSPTGTRPNCDLVSRPKNSNGISHDDMPFESMNYNTSAYKKQ